MFQKRTLFERLRNPEGTGRYTLDEDTTSLVQSILHNLTKMLNARTGQTPAQPDFGIPSPSEVAYDYPESVAMVQKRIRQSIEKYEPRLRDVQVMQIESDDDRLAVRFQITARLATSKDAPQVSFSTRVDPAGHVNLRS